MSEQWRVGETRIFGLSNRVGVPLLLILAVGATVLGIVAWLTGALVAIGAFVALSIVVAFSYMAWLPPRYWLGPNLPPYDRHGKRRK